MPMIFRLRLLSDENDSFVRLYDVAYSDSLFDLHMFICKDLGFNPEEMASFYTSNHDWECLDEFTLLDMHDEGDDAPELMEAVNICDVLRQNRDRLIYCFDMLNNRALYIELAGCYQSDPQTDYPAVRQSEGAAPDQFEAGAGNGSIFDQMMYEFEEFVGDESYDD